MIQSERTDRPSDRSAPGVFLRRVDRGDEHAANRAALIVDIFGRLPVKDTRLYKNFKPVFRFIAFLQRDLQLCDEIGFAVRVFRLADICADACRGTFQLIDKRRMSFYVFAELNCIYREFNR